MPLNLTTTAASISGLDLAWTGGAAGDVYTIELNRAEDFASDDSLTIDGVTTTSRAVRGLPCGTSFWMRIRANPAGTWSTPILRSTLPYQTIAAYTGFSIDKALLVVPEPVSNIFVKDLAGGVAAAGNPVSNLLRDDPASTWRYTATQATVYFETSGLPVDTIALLGALVGDGWRLRIEAFDTAANRDNRSGALYSDDTVYACSPNRDRPAFVHHFRQFPAVSLARFWAMTITAPANATSFFARNLIVGQGRMSVNASKGAGAATNDQGTFARNRFGTPDRVRGWRGRTLDMELSWVNEKEYQTKWSDLSARVGKTDSVLVIANSKRNAFLNDRIGFGTITNMRGENVQSFRFSQSVEIDSIY